MLSNKFNESTGSSSHQEKSKTKQAIMILGILLGLLALLNVVIFFRGNSKVNIAKEETAEISKERDQLLKEKEILKLRLDSLADLFPAREAEIEELKRQLDEARTAAARPHSSGNSAELADLRRQLEEMKVENQTLKQQLDDAKNNKVSSDEANSQLSKQLEAMSAKYAEQETKLAEYQKAAEKKEEVKKEEKRKEVMNKPLTASSVTLEALRVSKKDANKTEPTNKAGLTGRMRICFTVEPTADVPTGAQEFHFQIIHNQQTLGTREAPDKISGQSYKYTLDANYDYDGGTGNVCANYEPGDFEKGEYQVNVWHKGVKIGTASITLKK